VRRGTGSVVRLRRAMVVLASAGGNTVPAIARLVQADEDGVRVSQRSDVGLTAETRVEGISCVATRDTFGSAVAASQRSN
jgi:hypothetical protein